MDLQSEIRVDHLEVQSFQMFLLSDLLGNHKFT